MVYEYQKETIQYLTEFVEKMEEKTESKMSLKIGSARAETYVGNGYETIHGDLYLTIHNGNTFRLIDDNGFAKYIDDFDVFDDDDYIRFDSNLFLKLNELVDTIYKNNHERKKFYEKLNMELKELNKSL